MPRHIKKAQPTTAVPGYQRPADWLELPTPQTNEQVVYILAAVFPHYSNFAAILCRGAYTIDWGDGTIENYNDNTQANHTYNYSSIPDSTLSTRGYKQVIITIRPQQGQNLTRIEFYRRHPNNYSSGAFLQPWLHIRISGQYINFAKFYYDSATSPLLEMFEIYGQMAITDCSDMFQACYALQKINGLENITPTNILRMFRFCLGLVEAPYFNTANCTSLEETFYSCRNLTTIPTYSTSNLTSLLNTFYDCNKIVNLPNITTSNVTSIRRAFYNCYSLKYIPQYNLANVTTAYQAFQYCYSLAYFPASNLGQVTCNLQLTFDYCYTLETVRQVNAGTNSIDYFIDYCSSISYAGMNNLKNSFSISNRRFSRKALVDLFNYLGTVSGKTLTITGNWGVPYLTQQDITIATSKGWTVTT